MPHIHGRTVRRPKPGLLMCSILNQFSARSRKLQELVRSCCLPLRKFRFLKLKEITLLGNKPLLLTASPEYIHNIIVFGIWSLPDRSTDGKAWLENQLDDVFEDYHKEVRQGDWYGFWDYGDVWHCDEVVLSQVSQKNIALQYSTGYTQTSKPIYLRVHKV